MKIYGFVVAEGSVAMQLNWRARWKLDTTAGGGHGGGIRRSGHRRSRRRGSRHFLRLGRAKEYWPNRLGEPRWFVHRSEGKFVNLSCTTRPRLDYLVGDFFGNIKAPLEQGFYIMLGHLGIDAGTFAGGDEAANDDVLFEANQTVDLTLSGGVG